MGDTVDHIALLRKLEHFGIRGSTLDLFESYLNNRLQFVEIDTFRSSVKHSLPCSCIQGSKLAGTFYNIYNLEVPQLQTIMEKPDLLSAMTCQIRTLKLGV